MAERPQRDINDLTSQEPDEQPDLTPVEGGGQGDGRPAGNLRPVPSPRRSDPVIPPKMNDAPSGPSRTPIHGGGEGGGPRSDLSPVPDQPNSPAQPNPPSPTTDGGDQNQVAMPDSDPNQTPPSRSGVDTDAVGDPLPESVTAPEDDSDSDSSDSPRPDGNQDDSDDSENRPDPKQDDADAKEAGEQAGGKAGSAAEGAETAEAGASAAEAGAVAAEGAEAAVEAEAAAAIIMNPAAWLAIAVGALLLFFGIIFIIMIIGLAGGSSEGGTSTSSSSASGSVPGLPDISDIRIEKTGCSSGSAPGGCYQLPTQSKYWTTTTSYTTGSKCLVTLIAATSKAWKEAHPKDTVYIGDLNAPGHASHQEGEDVDIWTTTAADMELGTYSKDASIEYGKIWFSTKQIEYIFFNDAAVRSPVNAYAQQKKYPGVMQEWPNHEDHYHVRVTPSGNGECGK